MTQFTFQIRDLAIANPSFLNYMCTPRVRTSINSGALSTYGHGNRLAFLKLVQNPEHANFSLVPVKLSPAMFVIKAVATLQPKQLVRNENTKKNYEMLPSIPEPKTTKLNAESPNEDSEEVHEREKLRRQRISKANKGNTPWNKGRKHSPETLQRIKERTRLAMQDPKVKMKLANLGHAQSNETRKKIGLGVQIGWRKRREKLLIQETCFFNWQNLVAEAARQGLLDEEELEWDSYDKLNKQLQEQWAESEEQRKSMSKPKGNRRAPKSLEQRRKIAASIAAKWADPEYRNRVYSGLAKYHGTPTGVEKRKKPTGEGQSRKRSPKKEISDADLVALVVKTSTRQPKSKKNKGPMFKDPLAKAKLEMIKNIRARRASTDTKKNEALERAKSLITEAEKAAKALEVAATTSPIAQASLIETRKLIAEAVQLIQSIETEQSTPFENNNILVPFDYGDDTMKEDQINQSHPIALNGIHHVETSKGDVEDFDFVRLSFTDSSNGREQNGKDRSNFFDTSKMPEIGIYNDVGKPSPTEENDPPEKNGLVIKINGTPELAGHINGGSIKINGAAKLNGVLLQDTNLKKETTSTAVKKRWVRGRLVEAVEGE
ncbi:hypothetical protein V2J09_004574 [Rumex salicifolius]